MKLFARYDSILRSQDEMLQQGALDALADHGVTVHKHAIPTELGQENSGLTLKIERGDQFTGFDALIWAVGRRPLTADIGLETVGVKTDQDGFIVTDKFQQTNIENIYAHWRCHWARCINTRGHRCWQTSE